MTPKITGAEGELATLAHDFNNMAMAALGSIELALRGAGSPCRERVEDARLALRRSAELARRMVASLRRAEPGRAQLDRAALCRSAARIARAATREGVTIELRVDSRLPRLPGDRAALEQALVNLLVNACQSVEARRRSGGGPGKVELRAFRRAREAVLSVADTGLGLDPRLRGRLFTPFLSTKPGGTGLGLVGARSAALRHGGSIHARGNPGRGAEFSIRLPLPPTVLLAKPAGTLTDSCRVALERAGWRVLQVTDGLEAAHLLRRGAERFDALVADDALPRISAPCLLRLARKHAPGLKAIVLDSLNPAFPEDLAASVREALG
ncbi:MAG: hybrid sensor histidine kinase/response regulator, partial [Candidatus Rokubacteria bacterium]|nr:hybrid sensor histidine kinase/response regulator [Candidatus Rokubacteria bacterium]